VVLLASCQPLPPSPTPSRYLYVWAGTGHALHGRGVNFLAILDANPESRTYGAVIGTVPADSGVMPHHAEFELPRDRPLFVNDFMTGANLLIDHADPLKPRVAARLAEVPGYRQAHSFVRLHDTLVLATLQFGDSTVPGNPGALVEFDAAGNLVRTGPARDSSMPGAHIRPYGLTLLPAVDRALTTSSPMDLERTADVVQIWRLSDLTLLKTLAVPGLPGDSVERNPFELRTLADGRTVLLNTYECGFYRVTGLDGNPRIEAIGALRQPAMSGCGVPVLSGSYWIMPVAYGHRILAFDIQDPGKPRLVSELLTDSTFHPHWLSQDPRSDRIVVTGQGDGSPVVMMIRLDAATGTLTRDDRFGEAGTAGRVSFARQSWPNGIAGHAMPHAALFVP
jgi:hypothetical protein